MNTRMNTIVILTLMVFLSSGYAKPLHIKIGAIFHDGEEDNYKAFTEALTTLNDEEIAPIFVYKPIIKWVNSSSDSFKTSIYACSLIKEGVAAIFGPGSPHTREIVSSIASKFGIPHIEYTFRRIDNAQVPHNTINLYPNAEEISQALAAILKEMKWPQFTILYEDDDGLSRLQHILRLGSPVTNPVTVRQLVPAINEETREIDYRPVLKTVGNSTVFNVIFDVDPDRIFDILEQAQQVKLFGDYYNFIITCLHMPREKLVKVLKSSNANFTIIELFTDEAYDLYSVESACLYDSVFLFNDALKALYARIGNQGRNRLIEPKELSCSEEETYEVGPDIVALMREIASEGRITGKMNFDEFGRRSFKLRFIEYKDEKFSESATWEDRNFKMIRTEKERDANVIKSIEQKRFLVTTRPGEPYTMEVTDGSSRGFLIENKRWEGYSFDLIYHIAEILKFKYDFEIVPDGEYGTYNPDTKQWNGLIGRLLNRKADIAVCDLTITQSRQSAVDFTTPFMNLGISILFAKPDQKEPELFSFLSPFSIDVWIYVATAYLTVSLMLLIFGRMAPNEWQASHPCVQEPEELENNLTLSNSTWLATGTLMQQGSDIIPVAPSVRMCAGSWWFFVLIICSSYTANLAAFLTNDKMDVTINSVEDLAGQTKIQYGSIGKGSTASFFANSNVPLYKKMWQTMSDASPSVFTDSNLKGVERVAQGKHTYAFLMESTAIEYNIERNCNLMQVGTLLDNKGYGIAVPPNSPYRTKLSHAILTLQESGKLRELKDRWWLQGSKNCTSGAVAPDTSGALTMAHVGGVFLVLMICVIASLMMGIFEFLWNIRKVAIEEKITPKEALIAELKFILSFGKNTKPIKISQSRKSSSEKEATSTTHSIIPTGSFLRLDILDKVGREKSISNLSNNKSNNIK